MSLPQADTPAAGLAVQAHETLRPARSLTARLVFVAALGALPVLVLAGASLLWMFFERIESNFDALLTSYQQQLLSQREAWQFLKPLKVKILNFDPAASQINVEMRTAGRLQGTTWWLDALAVGR